MLPPRPCDYCGAPAVLGVPCGASTALWACANKTCNDAARLAAGAVRAHTQGWALQQLRDRRDAAKRGAELPAVDSEATFEALLARRAELMAQDRGEVASDDGWVAL